MTGFGPRIYRFETFELDAARFELRSDGNPVHVEPQVLSLLILLAGNRERMLGKDEIIDRIWDGRIVSESAVAARIKAARKAIGDDGSQQRLIRTIHGKGFRFVGEVTECDVARPAFQASLQPEVASASAITTALLNARQGRPSIAVLPFLMIGEPGPHDIVGDALPADIIMDLSRLHWLFVIARGSSFRFRGADVDPLAVGRELAVRYCLVGTIELAGNAVTVAITLVDTGDGETIWAEHYRGDLAELQDMRPEIEARVVAALEVQIPRNEVRIARGRPPAELDAWGAFHLGIDHMYRFTQADNAHAARLFERSLACDPYFSRALGGLSFTHFQNAFLGFAEDPEAERETARALAHRALEADRLDPFAHFNVGRSFWLDGLLEDSIGWFDRATSLSPSYAQGVYNRGLVSIMAGKPEAADADLKLALELSPLDPLAYAMVSGRALTHVQLGDYEHAAEFGSRAAMMPGAHKHITLIAALTVQLVGKRDQARNWLARARQADPALSAETFFRSFPFSHTRAREVIEKSLSTLGL
ncbi:winged helix-turn-helix domain-containing tetratricopeptide repeat protein [Novosphingobium mangrovi (ex Huang et al. 2023)]|uniref:Winged helix-turn-helix domain-containing protein n=1 Tax=Novosphingobium mangrovi (ex Huang et al. 2023) TaxID=2976432 RepID=A0ABT2I6N0_9SPHN|nr:winged helix-turn-helix domain-containing protein [Novosphingobium mangrovi (ex Huang et al. 2023)]MCT2400471.1 winged helix-turn-helix domain-containing protein [Novosphingobium mangrovi (ex Huang et al. 2023)]